MFLNSLFRAAFVHPGFKRFNFAFVSSHVLVLVQWHLAEVAGGVVVGVVDGGVEALDLCEGVGLDDALHVGLGVHEDEGQLGGELAADGAQEELDLGECAKEWRFEKGISEILIG